MELQKRVVFKHITLEEDKLRSMAPSFHIYIVK